MATSMSRGCCVYRERWLRILTTTTFYKGFYARNTFQAVRHLNNTIKYVITEALCHCNQPRWSVALYMSTIKKKRLYIKIR